MARRWGYLSIVRLSIPCKCAGSLLLWHWQPQIYRAARCLGDLGTGDGGANSPGKFKFETSGPHGAVAADGMILLISDQPEILPQMRIGNPFDLWRAKNDAAGHARPAKVQIG